MMTDRETIRREVVQELVDYIDGDAENGPRFGDDGATRWAYLDQIEGGTR